MLTMECNKDEAIRAKDLAEKKMKDRDFFGARRMALKAQRLFPDIENISQMLTICEVHCSAGVQANEEMNWHEILQVEPTADDLSIKKQYQKLAVLLHTDKNQLTGAEEAFKLIVEAYNVLSDQAKRHRYVMKMNADVKTTTQGGQSHQEGDTVKAKESCSGPLKKEKDSCSGTAFNGPKLQNEHPPKAFPPSQAKDSCSGPLRKKKDSCSGPLRKKKDGCSGTAFNGPKLQKEHPPKAFPPSQASWNTCPDCHMEYQNFPNMSYHSRFYHCAAPSVESDLDPKPLPTSTIPGNIRNYFGKDQEQFPFCRVKDTNLQNQYGNTSNMCRRQSMNTEQKVGSTDVILDAKVDGRNETSKGAEFMESTLSEVQQEQNSSKHANSNAGQKRVRRFILESSESDGIGTEDLASKGDDTPTKTFTPVSTPRRSTRLNKKDTYDEIGSEEGYSTTKLFVLSSTPRRTRRLKKNTVSNEVLCQDGNDDFIDSPCTKKLSDSSANTDCHNKELPHEVANMVEEVANKEEVVDSSTNAFSKRKKLAWLQDILQDGRKRTKRSKRWTRMKRKKPRTSQCSSDNLAEVRKLCYPDPEFWDFYKSRSASQFAVNQIWATYDNKDGMPRFYARIREVYVPGFKVRFTWLERNPGNKSEIAWSDKDLPVACGNYSLGASDVVEDQLMFSHLVTWQKGKKRFSYDIYPKLGEVWALFKDWSIGWCSDAGKHTNYKYEVVEVVSEFATNIGIRVIPLIKIEGFVSLFMRAEEKKEAPGLIPPSEILRFSHQIPAYRLSGNEREGIPANSMELDCASLPANFKLFPSTSLACKTSNVDKLGRHSSSHFSATVTDKECEYSVRVQQERRNNQKADFGVDMDNEKASPSSPLMFDYPDPEFHNFDKLRSFGNFSRGQIWALYSDIDKYPKYYGWIKKVELESQRLHVAWLEACPLREDEIRWIAEEMPIGCGTFRFTEQSMVFGRSEFFSHIVHTKHSTTGRWDIIPNCGEVWAVYKNWKVGWRRSDLQNCEYEVVEICKVTDSGIKVLLLTRVSGYRAVFKPERARNALATLEIEADEYIRFSHQVPGSRIMYESGEEELEGYWELDTAAVPDHLLS